MVTATTACPNCGQPGDHTEHTNEKGFAYRCKRATAAPTACPLTAEELRAWASREANNISSDLALWLADALEALAAKEAEIATLRNELDAAREAIRHMTPKENWSWVSGPALTAHNRKRCLQVVNRLPGPLHAAVHAAHEAQGSKAGNAPISSHDPSDEAVRS